MWEIPAAPSGSKIRSGWLSAFLNQTISRTRTVSVPYKLGEVVVGDDPFNGRREGLVCVKNGNFVGLQSTERIFFYDYRQLRRPD